MSFTLSSDICDKAVPKTRWSRDKRKGLPRFAFSQDPRTTAKIDSTRSLDKRPFKITFSTLPFPIPIMDGWNVFIERKMFTFRSIRKELKWFEIVDKKKRKLRMEKKKNAGINQLNYKLVYTSWAKRPPVEDRTGGARWVGGPWEEGVGGRLSRKFNLSRPPPVRSTCRFSVYSSPLLRRDSSPSQKLFTVLLEGRLIADRLPTFDSMKME